MYLFMLNDSQKALFLQLAYHLAVADGDYSDYEKALMDSYCQEMKTSFDSAAPIAPFGEAAARLAQVSSEAEKRIVLFEAIGLAMADGKYDSAERALISSLEETFGISGGFVRHCEALLGRYLELQSDINDLVLAAEE